MNGMDQIDSIHIPKGTTSERLERLHRIYSNLWGIMDNYQFTPALSQNKGKKRKKALLK